MSSGGGSHTTGGSGGGGGGASPNPTPLATQPTTPNTTLNLLITALQTLLAQAHSQGLITTEFRNQVLTGIGASLTVPTTPAPASPLLTAPFTQPLSLGNSGSEVTRLQTFLKNQGSAIYPEGLITGYFGQATLRAVQRFQVQYNIAHPGDTGYGLVGPATRAKINALLGL